MRTAAFTSAALFFVLCTSELVAQEPGTVLIRAGRLFDSEAGAFLENQDILVRGSRIAAVGPGLALPDGAETIDLGNYTVLPGLIDAHTHLLYLEDLSGSLTTEGLKALLLEGEPLRALHGAARARTFLDAGITTIRDLGNSGMFVDRALQRAIQDGSVPGPRMIVSGPGLSPVGGQFPGLQPEYADLAAREYRIVAGPEDAAEAVRENVTFGADVIKIFSNNTPNPGYLSVAEMRAIVDEAEVMGVRVAAHATDDRSIWRAVEAGVHSIEHGYQVTDSTLRFMKERGVALVPTDADSVTIMRFLELSGESAPGQGLSYLASRRARLRRAKTLGVTIVAGSDAYIDIAGPQGEAARRMLFAYHQAGLTPIEVLQAATLNGAELLGGEGRIGVIKPGAMADIIALEGNPEVDFDALERVRFVMKAGQVYRQP
ncbi:MAG: amidohydrolase family protein [Gemmatimonadales bacterium]|nr:amidohydrolase family protein [Gemmatimonadales bacterium]